jgi:hypothetical protein
MIIAAVPSLKHICCHPPDCAPPFNPNQPISNLFQTCFERVAGRRVPRKPQALQVAALTLCPPVQRLCPARQPGGWGRVQGATHASMHARRQAMPRGVPPFFSARNVPAACAALQPLKRRSNAVCLTPRRSCSPSCSTGCMRI